MAVSYKKLWKLLIDKDMKKSDLEKKAHISHYSLGLLSKGENVSTDVLNKICDLLGCSVDDIIEFISETPEDMK
ncbi:MAG: helix-turn-helix transcriptional regulator [Christensenellaceae bacterium]